VDTALGLFTSAASKPTTAATTATTVVPTSPDYPPPSATANTTNNTVVPVSPDYPPPPPQAPTTTVVAVGVTAPQPNEEKPVTKKRIYTRKLTVKPPVTGGAKNTRKLHHVIVDAAEDAVENPYYRVTNGIIDTISPKPDIPDEINDWVEDELQKQVGLD
jgi:hypothetical protein